MSSILIILSLFTLVSAQPSDFKQDKRYVSWRGQRIKGADPRSFQPTCPAEILDRKGDSPFCAMDAKNFYLGVAKVPGKDPVTFVTVARGDFKELGKNHFQIGRLVFFRSLTQPMDNADFATFNELEEENESGIDSRRQWASDHRDVYCAGQVVTGLSPKGLTFWPFLSWDCKDLVSTQIGSLPSTGYIKDEGAVFVYLDCKLHMRVPEADPESFNVPNILFPSRARDGKGHIYNCGKLTARRK